MLYTGYIDYISNKVLKFNIYYVYSVFNQYIISVKILYMEDKVII